MAHAKRKTMTVIIGFDTETYPDADNTQRFLSFQAYCPELNINVFSRIADELCNLFTHRTRNAIMMAMNAEFDALVIAKQLWELGFETTFYHSKSRFLKLRITDRNRNTWRMFDLANLFPTLSLAKIGRIVGLRKMRPPEWLGRRRPKANEWTQLRRYALRDAEICYRAGRLLLNKFGYISQSIASISLKEFKKTYRFLGINQRYARDINKQISRAYRGGRCESFVRGSVGQKIYYYDVNSMYPYVMAYRVYPTPTRPLNKKHNVNLDNEGVALATIQQDFDTPPLGVKMEMLSYTPSGRLKRTKKLMFVDGLITGWFTYPELRYLELLEGGKIVKIHEAFETNQAHSPFQEYILRLWKERQRYRQEKSPMQWITKYQMNTLYGKFGQRIEGNIFRYAGRFIRKDLKPRISFTSNLLWASYITAYGRIHIHNLMRKFKNVLYCDTDSILTTEHRKFNGKKLGELKLEGEFNEALFLRAKFYALRGDYDKVVARGIFVPIGFDELLMMIFTNRLTLSKNWFIRLRSAMHRHKLPLQGTPRRIRINTYPDGKRDYHRDLDRRALLVEMTESDPIKVTT